MARATEKHRWLGPPSRAALLRPASGVDPAQQIRELVGNAWVDEIVVEAPLAPETLARCIQASRQAGRPLRIDGPIPAPQLPEALPNERWVYRKTNGKSSSILTGRQRGIERLLKRLLDLAVALPLTVLLIPAFIGIALAVRFSSPGPILYRWRVLGRNGRPFTGYKFRTMVRDADSLKVHLLDRNEMLGPVFKLTDDPRVTPIGRWLRRYSLDELPQLWNVIRGDMSLVGPRPVFRDEYRQFELWQMRKLSVTPGVTCLWQVNGRNTIKGLADWVRLDLSYIDRWSLFLDFKILAHTVPAVVKGTGV
jgi:lipopolysaccharide/colanic/teichoic acid biosynthesis glycosyltransferase